MSRLGTTKVWLVSLTFENRIVYEFRKFKVKTELHEPDFPLFSLLFPPTIAGLGKMSVWLLVAWLAGWRIKKKKSTKRILFCCTSELAPAFAC